MRKWMRDRLKRPKKNTEGNQSGPAQAPLQPAFYDAADASAPAAPIRPAESETQPAPQPLAIQEVASETPPSQARRPAGSGDPRRRRRRGRGGRGRGGTQAATAPPAEESRAGAAESAQPVAGSAPEIADAVKTTTPAAPRTSKGTVVLAIGLPGSGKSSWFKRHNITPLSSDMVRALLFDDPTEQRFQDLVFSNLRSMLKARLIARRPMNYVDATNLTPHERQSWIKLGQDYGYEVQAVFFDVPLEVCLERNHKRERVVSDDVMRRMSAKLKAPTFEEGFSKITVVRVKRKE
ncbi:MAG: AAA family ATPase [Terriglobales bacterium]